jgi:hypothetical protein
MLCAQAYPSPPLRRWGLVRQRRSFLERFFGTSPTAAFGSREPSFSASSALCTSCLVGKATPNDTSKDAVGASGIVDPVRNAVGVPEIELGKIAVKVLLGAMLIDALHAALEDARNSLRRCWYADCALPFTTYSPALWFTVAWLREVPANASDRAGNRRSSAWLHASSVARHGSGRWSPLHVVQNVAAGRTAVAIDQREHLHLVRPAAMMLRRALAGADEGLVGLDHAAAWPKGPGHRSASPRGCGAT